MKSVYEASNSVDAHMMLNLLRAEGFEGRVDGEFLQGGMGELQAIGLIDVLVNEADYRGALSVVREWESGQRPKAEASKATSSNQRGISIFVLGVMAGVIALLILMGGAA